jgi:hypothetical protein
VKAHAGTIGNELADTLAKKAATNGTISESAVLRHLEEESVRKWQRSWTQTTKGSTTKEYFPDIEGRLKMKLHHTGNLNNHFNGTWKHQRITKSVSNRRRI